MSQCHNCAICFERITTNENNYYMLQCNHEGDFHPQCISHWYTSQLNKGCEPKCPLCRIPFRSFKKIGSKQTERVSIGWMGRFVNSMQVSMMPQQTDIYDFQLTLAIIYCRMSLEEHFQTLAMNTLFCLITQSHDAWLFGAMCISTMVALFMISSLTKVSMCMYACIYVLSSVFGFYITRLHGMTDSGFFFSGLKMFAFLSHHQVHLINVIPVAYSALCRHTSFTQST